MIINGINFDFKLTCLKIEMQLKIERKFKEEEQARQFQQLQMLIDRTTELMRQSMISAEHLTMLDDWTNLNISRRLGKQVYHPKSILYLP